MRHIMKLNKIMIFSLMVGLFQPSLANERIQNKFMDQAAQNKAWTVHSSSSINIQKSSNPTNSLLQHLEIPLPSSEEKHAEIFDLGKVTPSSSNIRFNLNNNYPFYCSLDRLAPSCQRHSDSFSRESFLNGATFSGSLLFPNPKN